MPEGLVNNNSPTHTSNEYRPLTPVISRHINDVRTPNLDVEDGISAEVKWFTLEDVAKENDLVVLRLIKVYYEHLIRSCYAEEEFYTCMMLKCVNEKIKFIL